MMTVGPSNEGAATTVPPASLEDVPTGATVRPPPEWVENASCYSPALLLDSPDHHRLMTTATPVTAFKVGFIFEQLWCKGGNPL